jgi:hypothetical protein
MDKKGRRREGKMLESKGKRARRKEERGYEISNQTD